jgi:prepilin-type N-terminal cleavage/methylation domain-containing protein
MRRRHVSTTTFRNAGRSRLAFTLIELLVVIAIIAILAAILFPVFAQARAKARQTSCLSNTKQLTLGFMQYVQDYDEMFPYWNWSLSSDNSGYGGPGTTKGHLESTWFNAIYPYVKNGQVYACPDDNLKLTPSGSAVGGWGKNTGDAAMQAYGINPTLWRQIMSYGVNEPLHFGELGNPAPYPGTSGTALAQLDRVASTMLLADSIWPTTGSSFNGDGSWTRTPDPNNPNDNAHYCLINRVAFAKDPSVQYDYQAGMACGQPPASWRAVADSKSRHSAGENIGLADGHSKWYRNMRITNDLFAGTNVGGG